ncbi:conserved Plasmodium protein, unknown function [Plasmodium knowlesi strain H]|uniref:Uncharacterized protein n=3 Tax=Plasmodium knowlesi TaxID=5850 RepID=A0A5K1UUU4_PLAKH|nr:conserved Plasmodium protein, unknown function [Plasmodium knowlesi strain H]OTN65412.1 Uncharacterized protein PKNOH_S110074700 [Plasmodium knowlesi]CAA9989368.1 conserved Plasmodium protein, unknown function [Plasmodium knowlesi strain H]SBO24946.1 conserved Plasmodium protein, unknown function [Plasmodium knowlesi strain H]SBO27904.1 conserved Plasmodium protein, unknown function [Plasmodium knowlesi strain H]VVS78842.1 conserved Plasmodium protein, unknown function [Plasmodium knowlesi |eukprot:XP_002260095.1 hypothetical protein, conserved in Plasmodium species [Plasmodium knowlesi strain H]
MNSYRKHSLSFYVLDAAECGGDFSALWRDLEFVPKEDIIIISIKNDLKRGNLHGENNYHVQDNHLRMAIKAKLEQWARQCNQNMLCDGKDQYELVDPNFQFEGNSFILFVRVELRKYIRQVYARSVKLRVRRSYGKRYRMIMRHYFDHSVMGMPPHGGNNPAQEGVAQRGMAQRTAKRMAKRSGASQAEADSLRRRTRCLSEGTNVCIKIDREGERQGKRKRHDDNVVICITFTFKGITLCVCLSNIDLEKHVERCEYYRCLLSAEKWHANEDNRPGSGWTQSISSPTNSRRNYAEMFLENYRLCFKQMYNHFTNNITFETDKEDLHLFGMDIVVLQGFNQLVLFNHLRDSNLHNDSLIWGNNIAILNKNEKNILQKRSYFTLTCSGKNAELVPLGFKFCCDLFSQMEVSIVDDFFLSQVGEGNRGQGQVHIGVKPEVLELGSIYTYQVGQASFHLDYTHAGCGSGDDYENGGHLSFSILCFDPKSQSTIPINLYSYLHLKKNSIFKYLEENVRFGRSQSSRRRKECCGVPAYEQNNLDMMRHIYVYPHKGIVRQNEEKKIWLNIYVDHMLKKDEVVEGSFILIIRFHKCGKDIKQIFIACRYCLRDNIVSVLLRDDRPLVRTLWDNHTSMKGWSRHSRTTRVKTNMSLHSRTTRVKTNMSLHSRTRRNVVSTCNRTKRSEEGKGRRPFLPSNITKFVLYSFFTIDQYERELLSGVGSPPSQLIRASPEADKPLYPLGLCSLHTDHLVYCFSPTSSLQDDNKKGVQCNLNYHWKKHFFCVQYPQEKYIDENFFLQSRIMESNVKRQSGDDVPLEVHYLVGQIQKSGKVDRPISVGTILLLWEELFRVLTPPFGTFAQVIQMVRRIYNHPKLQQKKKMHLIFRIIVRKSPSVLYKNLFLILLSFLKKLFFYFVQVCLHDFGISMEGAHVQGGEMSNGPFGKYPSLRTTAQVETIRPFPLFMRAFHFFHVSFLSYLTTFFLSFLDHQIGLDLAHYLLFHG